MGLVYIKGQAGGASLNKKIEFITTDELADYADGVISAQKNMPQWFKEIPIVSKDDLRINDNGSVKNKTVKHCMPFFDAMSFGYHIVLATDIHFKYDNGQVNYKYPVVELISHRDKPAGIPISDEFYNIEFTWKMLWTPKTPKGYSCLVTHPINRIDLPFQTLSGIIDSDVFYHSQNGNLPFYLKKEFEGVLKKGTPIAQVIPFKRDNWKSHVVEYDKDEVQKRMFQKSSVFVDFYKKFAYVKKIFK